MWRLKRVPEVPTRMVEGAACPQLLVRVAARKKGLWKIAGSEKIGPNTRFWLLSRGVHVVYRQSLYRG